MALIKCSECNKEISDKAKLCVHCGCPVLLDVASTQEELDNILYNIYSTLEKRLPKITLIGGKENFQINSLPTETKQIICRNTPDISFDGDINPYIQIIGDCIIEKSVYNFACLNFHIGKTTESSWERGLDIYYEMYTDSSIVIPNRYTEISNDAFKGYEKSECVQHEPDVWSHSNYIISVKDIFIPDSVNHIEKGTFSNFKNITIRCHKHSYAYKYCQGCSNIKVEVVDVHDFVEPKKILTTQIARKLLDEYIVIPYGYVEISESAFKGYSILTSIEIPNSVTVIGAHTFEDCTSLRSIEIPENVTSIGDYTFYRCCNLTNIKIPDSVAKIGRGAFCGCCSLTNIGIPDGVTSIGEYAFEDCSSLTYIEIPNCQTEIGYRAFDGCISLTNIKIPNRWTEIGQSKFKGYSNLTSIKIPDSVTSIGSGAFEGCTSLTSIEIPNSVIRIGDGAFKGCSSLTNIEIPDSVTSIGSGAFEGCNKLEVICLKFSYTHKYCVNNRIETIVTKKD